MIFMNSNKEISYAVEDNLDYDELEIDSSININDDVSYPIKDILDYYETEMDNSTSAHDDSYYLAKNFISGPDEIKYIVLNRKCIYYELKYPIVEINSFDKEGNIQSAIDDYVDCVDESLNYHKESSVINNRDLEVFYPENKVNSSGDPKPAMIDIKLHKLYESVY